MESLEKLGKEFGIKIHKNYQNPDKQKPKV